MLFINWRKHYDVPNIIAFHNNFKSNRKAKFFFLSDLVLKLINRYCFRRVLYYYIDYIYNKRLIEHSKNINDNLYGKKSYYSHILYNESHYIKKKKIIIILILKFFL